MSVRRFVRFAGGNQRLYDLAQAEHARSLDRLETNGVDYHVLLGTGEQTVGRVRIRPTSIRFDPGVGGEGRQPGGIYTVRWENGDETVPRTSASLGETVAEDHLHFVCGVDHLELAQEQAVFERIGGFLRAGEPIAGVDRICPARGVEVQTFTLALGARVATAGSMTLEQADKAGAIELLDFGAQKLFAANASRPVKLHLDGRGIGVRVTPLGDDGARGRPRDYGPLSGTLTIDAGADAEIRRDGRLLRPRSGADRRPPVTRVRVRRLGRHAVLRFRATDSSGVAATFATFGSRPATRVRGSLRIKRGDLRRLRFQSVDAFGNLERPRRAHASLAGN